MSGQYPLDPRERVVVGYSLSGRFATYTLFNAPDAFGRYLIVSPWLWWDRDSTFLEEEAWARSNTDLQAKVFLVGGDAEETPGDSWCNNLPDETDLQLKDAVQNERSRS